MNAAKTTDSSNSQPEPVLLEYADPYHEPIDVRDVRTYLPHAIVVFILIGPLGIPPLICSINAAFHKRYGSLHTARYWGNWTAIIGIVMLIAAAAVGFANFVFSLRLGWLYSWF